jgi:methionine-rich copper-binding protein CopC
MMRAISKLFSLKKPAGASGLLLALILIFAFAGPALAVPAQPHQFYGQVTVGGAPAPQGIEVVAKIGGVQYASTVTDDQGRYGYNPVFYVPADDPDTPTKDGGRNGDTVEFYVVGVLAGSSPFEIGGVTKLDLAITALPDTTKPTVSITDPANNATSVAVDKTITVTFSEDVKAGAAYDGIVLKDAEGNAVAVTKSIDGKVLTIKPTANLTYSTTYTVVIPAGAVADLAGNPLAEDYAFNFTTEAAPVVLEQLKVTPDSLSLSVGEQAQLEVKAVYSDGTEADVTAEASYTSGNMNVVTVSSSGLVTAVAAGETVVTVVYGDKSAQVLVVVTEVAPQKYTVTFTVTDQDQKPIEGVEITIQGVEGMLTTDERGQASVELEPGAYNFTVTAEGYQDYQGSFEVADGDVDVTVAMQVAEGEQPPAEGEQPPEVTEPDTTAPAEVADLVVTPLPGAGVFGISFTAPSDSDLRGVAVYATVYGSNDWEQVEFENGSMVCSCRPGESVDIPVQAPGNLVLGSDRVQFKVVAIDTSGNASQGVVADNNGQGYPVLAYWSLTSGPEGWTTFSVPVQLAGAQRLLGDVIDNNKVDIAFKFDAATQQWVQVTEENKNNTIQPLEAVYVKLKEPVLAVIKPSTEPTSPPVRNLLKGWNLVGFTKADNVYDAFYSVRERWSVSVSPVVNPDPWAVTPRQNAAVKTHYGYWVYMDESGNLAGFSTTPVTVGTYPFERE